MNVSSTHDHWQLYRRLERTASLIIRHPNFPGKGEALNLCRKDVEERYLQGMLSDEQRARLQAILNGEDPLD